MFSFIKFDPLPQRGRTLPMKIMILTNFNQHYLRLLLFFSANYFSEETFKRFFSIQSYVKIQHNIVAPSHFWRSWFEQIKLKITIPEDASTQVPAFLANCFSNGFFSIYSFVNLWPHPLLWPHPTQGILIWTNMNPTWGSIHTSFNFSGWLDSEKIFKDLI